MTKKLIISDIEFLRVINTLVEKAGYSPTIRELVESTPYSSTSSLSYRLDLLEKAGYILRVAFIARTIKLTEIGFALISIKKTLPAKNPHYVLAQQII